MARDVVVKVVCTASDSKVNKSNYVKYLDLLKREEFNFWPRKLQAAHLCKKETGPLPSFTPVPSKTQLVPIHAGAAPGNPQAF